jgi:hypothetical protein
VLINLSDIPQLCKLLIDLCVDLEKPRNLNLHADNNVSDEFLKRIGLMVPDTFAIHGVVKAKSDIGLLKIR